jgi:hypothetical protein
MPWNKSSCSGVASNKDNKEDPISIPNKNLILEIQGRSGTGGLDEVAYLSTMARPLLSTRGKWTDVPYKTSSGIMPINDQPHKHDLFFSPLVFFGKRQNETVSHPGVLFADLDGAPDPVIEPTIIWETSPGNRQAVWYISDPGFLTGYQQWANLNQRMTLLTKADVGGWMGSKVLRVPESINWKRQAFGGPPIYLEVSYTVSYLEKFLPQLPMTNVSLEGRPDHPSLPPLERRDYLIRSYWHMMSLRGRNMITKDRVRDRSLHIVKTAYELTGGGLSPEVVFNLLWGAPWNKWRTDRYAPEQLWSEILRTTE